MLERIILIVVKLLAKFGMAKKQEADASKAKAVSKTLETVDESLKVERDIRDKQKKDEESDVQKDDGGLDFGRFNSDSE